MTKVSSIPMDRKYFSLISSQHLFSFNLDCNLMKMTTPINFKKILHYTSGVTTFRPIFIGHAHIYFLKFEIE
jgi:predicted oxidoreductase